MLWAEQHRDFLRALLEGYFRAKQGQILAEVAGSAYAVIAPAIPWQVPFIVGDCLQNLRTSLDYLARDLCLSSGGYPTNYTSFPVCKTPKCFQSAITQRALAGIPVAAVSEIEKLQPYLCGVSDPETSNLWILHELCNINKHRRIPLVPLRVHDHYAAPVEMRDQGPME